MQNASVLWSSVSAGYTIIVILHYVLIFLWNYSDKKENWNALNLSLLQELIM